MMLRLALSVSLGVAAMPAAELVIDDAYLRLLWRDPGYELTINDGADGFTVDDDFEVGSGLAFGYRRSLAGPGRRWGPVLSLAATIDGSEADDLEVLSLGGRGGLGLGLAVNDRLSFVLEAGLGYAWSQFDQAGTALSDEFSADGTMLSYDLKVEALWRVTRNVVIGVEVGWHETEYEFSGRGLDLDLDQGGVLVGLSLAWRFDPRPRRLE